MSIHSIGYLFKEGLKGLWKNRTMSIASICVLISCLLLTGIAGLLSLNLSATMQTFESANTINVYLKDGLPALTAVKVGEEIRALDNIGGCTFLPKEEGLKNTVESMMRENRQNRQEDGQDGSDAAQNDLWQALEGKDNPLPDTYIISMDDLSKYSETIAALLSIEGVDTTSDYSVVASRLSDLDRLVRYCSLGILIVMGLVSLFIIANTLKVTIFSRRMEINIMKSVGATNGFIRIPFIVEGVLIGILSGLISATALYFGYDKAVEAVYGIISILTIIDIHPYIFTLYLAYVIVGTIFGLMGGVISIRKYLKKEGENAII